MTGATMLNKAQTCRVQADSGNCCPKQVLNDRQKLSRIGLERKALDVGLNSGGIGRKSRE